MTKPLYLHEEFLLLSLQDATGTSIPTQYAYALSGAIVGELLLQERIVISDDGKQIVSICSDKPLGNEVLDDSLRRIKESRREQVLTVWIQSLAHIRDLKHKIAASLCKQGILKQEIQKVLWLFEKRIYPEVDPQPEQEIKSRLAELLFTQSPKLDERTLVLASLANSGGLLRFNFDRDLLHQHKDRISQIANGEILGGAASQTLKNVQNALLVSTIIPVVVTTTIINT